VQAGHPVGYGFGDSEQGGILCLPQSLLEVGSVAPIALG
jgi:hypothetical protein